MKEIKNFTGYFVTEEGQVFSCQLRCTEKNIEKPRRIIGGQKKGYKSVLLKHPDTGKFCRRYIHRLVLEAFVGECPQGMEACHNNGDRTDNRLENLRWDTRKNNHADKRLHGTYLFGEKCSAVRLNESQVQEVRSIKRNKPKLSYKKIAEAFQVSPSTIFRIIRRTTWKHL